MHRISSNGVAPLRQTGRPSSETGTASLPKIGLVAAAVFLFAVTPALAQDWDEFTSKTDRFTIDLPGQPKVQDLKWHSEYGADFPAHVYSVDQGSSHYSVTVVDYTDAERIHADRPNRTQAESNGAYWMVDIAGSIDYAAAKFRQREGVKVTYDAYHYIDLISGHELQLVNPDQSRTSVGIYLHENRLYILEATIPKGSPPPLLFTQTVAFLDEMGNHVRYPTIYYNHFPPARLGRGGRGGRGGAGGGGTTNP
jgi:hypothetical protein